MDKCKYCGKLKKHGHVCKEQLEYIKNKINLVLTDFIEKYKSGYSMHELCKIYELPRGRMEKVLQNAGVELRTTSTMHNKRRYDKAKKTSLKKYGVDNPAKSEKIKNKVKKTMQDRFGDNPAKLNDFKYYLYIIGRSVKPEDKENFDKFNKSVVKLTKKNKQKLKEESTCYYTNVPFVQNKHYNDNHRMSVDHKTSIMKAFELGWSVEKTAGVNNLCYCTRLCNSVKRGMTENEFKKSETLKRLLEYENKKNN